MNSPEASPPKASLSDLAAERTLLAWIRAGLALMGFGFVIARLWLFLHQIQLVNHETSAQQSGLSLWFGTGLIAAGVFVNILAGFRHTHLVRRLELGDPRAISSRNLILRRRSSLSFSFWPSSAWQ